MRSAPKEFKVSAVRLDSGDLGALARETRRMLDAAGLQGIGIFVTVSDALEQHHARVRDTVRTHRA